MSDFLAELQKNLKGIWARLDGAQRLVVGAVMVAATVGLVAIVWVATQPSYVGVFTPTSGADMLEARRKLDQAQVKYVIDDTGQGLMVERGDFGRGKAALMEAGLLDGNNSSDLVSGTFIEDAATKKFRLNEATRKQAERAIMELEAVRTAIVSATPPRTSAFVKFDNDRQARATVLLHIRPGTPFESVARSAASIASSQLGVDMQNVEVTDGATYRRWRYDPDREAGGGSTEFLAMQREMSDERTGIAQALLDSIYPGQTRVTVHVELDPKWEIRQERVLPDTPYAIRDKKTTDSTEDSTTTPLAAGDPSLASYQPTPAGGTPDTRNVTKKEEREREFLSDIGTRRTGTFMPEIKRISVALAYDKKLQLSDEDRSKLEDAVRRAVAFDEQRDEFADSLEVAFPELPAIEVAAPGPGFGDVAKEWAPLVAQLVGVVLVLLFLKSLLKSSGSPRPAVAGAPQATAAPEEEDQNLSTEEQQRRMRREIERAIASDPAALAKMFESWLSEVKA
jgi:flagellar biosynthesis/type III secretory pathway M-ring protein FliF/YscJ